MRKGYFAKEPVVVNSYFNRLRDHGGIERLVSIARSVRFKPRCSKAAAAVLAALWKHRSLRTKYRQDGWSHTHFNSKPPKHPLALSEHSRGWLVYVATSKQTITTILKPILGDRCVRCLRLGVPLSWIWMFQQDIGHRREVLGKGVFFE